jgi:hypothetical protein
MENWREIIGYEGIYQVSNLGNVKHNDFMMKPFAGKHGYLSVSLFKNKKRKDHRVHRLVITCFLDNTEHKEYINHLDGNKKNNKLENLKWVTASENTQHAYDTGLKFGMDGEKHPMSKLTEKEVFEIRAIGKTKYLREIAEMYNVRLTTISWILTNKSWKHLLGRVI